MTPHPAIALAATILLGGCGTAVTADTQPADTTPATSSSPPSTIRTIAPAVATAPATPVTQRTLPPLDPCGPQAHNYVNGLAYQPDNTQPSTVAYRAVATCRGWSQATQNFYQAGIIDDIFVGESRQCPLVIGGQNVLDDCTPTGPANHEDAGWFQITSAGWGRNSLLCKAGLYCSRASIIATPWDSMNAGLALIELSQPTNFPWNWDYDAKQYHPSLGHWPQQWVNLP